MIEKLKAWLRIMFGFGVVKPNIKLCAAGGYICHGLCASGFGATPAKAYEDWRKNMIESLGISYDD